MTASVLSSKMMSSVSQNTTYHPKRPRRFAPLDLNADNKHDAPKLKGIIFDVDGTLWYDTRLGDRAVCKAGHMAVMSSVNALHI